MCWSMPTFWKNSSLLSLTIQKWQRFTTLCGDLPRLKISVHPVKPPTFDEAVRIAQEKESAVRTIDQKGMGVAPMELGSVTDMNMAYSGGGHKAQDNKLTDEQRAELRKRNACF